MRHFRTKCRVNLYIASTFIKQLHTDHDNLYLYLYNKEFLGKTLNLRRSHTECIYRRLIIFIYLFILGLFYDVFNSLN
jgi:hypothetical protein